MKIKTAIAAMGYTFQIEFDDIDEAPPAAKWFTDLIEYFIEIDAKPAGGTAVAAPAERPAPAAGGYSRAGGTPNAPRRAPNAGGFTCPVHGDEQIGAGFKGNGQECKVWTQDPEQDDPNGEWVRTDADGYYKPANMKDGSVRYYCRHRSEQSGSGGGYRRAA